MSHHSRSPFNFDDLPEDERERCDFLMKQLTAAQHQFQDEFPDGRLNKDDQGAVGVVVGLQNGKVFMALPHPTSWVGFTPDQAVEIANALLKNARAVILSDLPHDHKLRNTPLHLIRASYQWTGTNRPNDWHRVTKSFTTAKSTYNELAASWTEAYRWRADEQS